MRRSPARHLGAADGHRGGPGGDVRPVPGLRAPDHRSEPAPRRRLSFKDKHALETLPGTIARLQQEAATLQLRLDDPDFYVKDRAGFEKTTTSLGEIQHKIAAAEEQWLALEIQREELEGRSE